MIENGEQKAELLTKVTNLEHDDDFTGGMQPDLSASGQLTFNKSGKEAPLPSNAEELRERLRVWGTSWMFAALKHPGRHLL